LNNLIKATWSNSIFKMLNLKFVRVKSRASGELAVMAEICFCRS